MTLPLHDYPDYQKPLATSDQIALTTNPNLNAGANLITAVVDMRQYTSFMLRVRAATNPAPTQYNVARVNMLWYDDAAQDNIIWEDAYEINSNQASASFTCPNGRLHVQDNCHGPFLVVFVNNGGADQMNVAIEVIGTSRFFAQPYIQELHDSVPTVLNSSDPCVLDESQTLAGGAIQRRAVRIAPGRVQIRMATGAAPYTFSFQWGLMLVGHTFTLVAGTTTLAEMVWPKRSAQATMTNTGGVAGVYNLDVTRLVAPY